MIKVTSLIPFSEPSRNFGGGLSGLRCLGKGFRLEVVFVGRAGCFLACHVQLFYVPTLGFYNTNLQEIYPHQKQRISNKCSGDETHDMHFLQALIED